MAPWSGRSTRAKALLTVMVRWRHRLSPPTVNGNVYVVGTFSGNVDLGGQVSESQSTQDVFLLKYGETGAFLWAAQTSGINAEDQIRAVGAAVDSVGNTYVLGEFKEVSVLAVVRLWPASSVPQICFWLGSL